MKVWNKDLADHELRAYRWSAVIASIGAVLGLALVIAFPKPSVIGAATVGAWLLLPPIVFWYEWFFLVDHKIPEKASRAKDDIDIKRNIRAAVGVLLAIIYTL